MWQQKDMIQVEMNDNKTNSMMGEGLMTAWCVCVCVHV